MAADLQLPPGFRFHPTDEELVMHYLCRKCASQPIEVPIIAEIDLYKYHPWDLPDLALYGEKEWYFFSPRDRKYPNGSRPNRSAGCGYWKATGVDKPIGRPRPVGIKKALVFYAGKAPKGDKTNWIMHEYRLANVDRSATKSTSSNMRLDDWILCRIYNKKGKREKLHVSGSLGLNDNNTLEDEEKKPDILTSYLTAGAPQVYNDPMYLDPSDSAPRRHTDSSCSEHVASSELTCEVQSNNGPKLEHWDKNALDFPLHYMSATSALDNNIVWSNNQFGSHYQMPTLQDMFMYP